MLNHAAGIANTKGAANSSAQHHVFGFLAIAGAANCYLVGMSVQACVVKIAAFSSDSVWNVPHRTKFY